MRKTLSTAVLVLALCCPISAGVIHNPPPEPTPLVEEVVLEPAYVAETGSTDTDSPGWSDSLTVITLDLLAVLSALS
jgi:hypothetical protein